MDIFGHNPIGFEDIYIRSEQQAKDNLAQTILTELLNLYNASRSYIFSFDDEFNIQKCLYEVCANGITKEIDNLQEVPTSASVWWCDELRKNKIISIRDIEESRSVTGEETYFILKSQGIKSVLVAPLLYSGWVYGYIGVDIVDNCYDWENKDIQMIKAFANSFTSVLYQNDRDDIELNQLCSFQKYLPHYLEILGTLPVNIIIFNPQGILLGANKKARSLFNFDKEVETKIIGHANLFDYFVFSEDAKKSFQNGEDFNTEIIFHFDKIKSFRHSDSDKVRCFSCNAVPLKSVNGNTNAYLMVLNDITERYLMAKSLHKAKKNAEESDRLKSAFLANMSHEIRTPLNAIVGFSSLLIETQNEKEKQEYSSIISSNTDILLCLINDILDLSKIESGAMRWYMKDVDFSSFFDILSLSLQQRVNRDNINFIVENPYKECIVHIDKNRMAQAITNYVTNAIKYTEKGFVKMGYRIKDKGIEVYVSDSGIGIADSKKNKVFKRFEKLDQFAAGNGLGLSITKGLIKAVGGKVYFDSVEGEGSTFYLWRPCKQIKYTLK